MSLQESITIAEAIDTLNRALDADRQAVSTLFLACRVQCNLKLADDPTVQIRDEGHGKFTVSALGILNGLFGVDDEFSYGPITAKVGVDGQINRFYPTDFSRLRKNKS